ncbi:hypothetical protein [uncultured Brevundimonas sp.]|uniref:hypothetical protein n=1 Tax=uncultured Brevundimonas sp. TaxID=213418 RepID=UPI0025E04764|nr:hypothetical protein [uncultured Brevundimonas sp.]
MNDYPLCILIIPSLQSGQWRASLEQEAKNQGWNYIAAGRSIDDEITSPRTLIVSESVSAFRPFPAQCVTILHTDPDNVIDLFWHMDPVERRYIVGRASIFLAEAETLAREGAKVVRHTSELELGTPFRPISLTQPRNDHPMGVLGMFDELPCRSGCVITWPPTLFRYTAPPAGMAQAVGDIELVGPPRALVFGPYIHLPSGSWHLALDIHIEVEGTPISLTLEWGDHFDSPASPVRFNKSGIYRLGFSATLDSTRPAELRVSIPTASLHGYLRILGATLSYSGSACLDISN